MKFIRMSICLPILMVVVPVAFATEAVMQFFVFILDGLEDWLSFLEKLELEKEK